MFEIIVKGICYARNQQEAKQQNLIKQQAESTIYATPFQCST